MLRSVHNEIPFSYVLADLWYAAADNMTFVVRVLRKHFVLPLKGNRKVALSQAALSYVTCDEKDR